MALIAKKEAFNILHHSSLPESAVGRCYRDIKGENALAS
jgi:hypothetical protein